MTVAMIGAGTIANILGRRAVMPQIGMPSRALGGFTPILKKRNNHGYSGSV